MFGLFQSKEKKNIAELVEDVEKLKAKMRVMETDHMEAQEKVVATLRKLQARHDMRDIRASKAEEMEELKAELVSSGIDLTNPQEAILKVMENPKLMNYAINKITKELIL